MTVTVIVTVPRIVTVTVTVTVTDCSTWERQRLLSHEFNADTRC